MRPRNWMTSRLFIILMKTAERSCDDNDDLGEFQGFQPIGIHIYLVGVEVWNTGDKISIISSNEDATLASFADYRKRKINPITYNDNAVLITQASLLRIRLL